MNSLTKFDPSSLQTPATGKNVPAAAKAIAKLAFPEYKGRKFSVAQQTSYVMEDYWSGGSRTRVVAVKLSDMTVHAPADVVHNPFKTAAHAEFEIPEGVAMVEHSIFCGQDAGLRVVVRKAP